MKYNFNLAELTKEKSLWDIYRLVKRIKSSKFNSLVVLVVVVVLAANSFYFESDIQITLGKVRIWSEIGFDFATTILGFLVAGFTIFATITKPSMLLAMMEHRHEQNDLPYLKYNFAVFMKVFIFYLVIASLCLGSNSR